MRFGDVYLSYLPMAHVYEMSLHMMMIHEGASIGFFRGDVKLLLEDLQLVRPTMFCTVPRILNRIYDNVSANLRFFPLSSHTCEHCSSVLVGQCKSALQWRNCSFALRTWSQVQAQSVGKVRIFSQSSHQIEPCKPDRFRFSSKHPF